MFKNIVIGFLVLSTVLSIGLAYRNAKPVCEDLQRASNGDLICSFNLGDIPEDEADVIIVEGVQK
jgi:hypothetical protein